MTWFLPLVVWISAVWLGSAIVRAADAIVVALNYATQQIVLAIREGEGW